MDGADVRTVAVLGAGYGLVGGGVVFAVLVGVRTLFSLLTLRGFLFFATLGCFVLGVAPFMLAGPSTMDADDFHGSSDGMGDSLVVDADAGGQLRFKAGLPVLVAGLYALAAFLLLGST